MHSLIPSNGAPLFAGESRAHKELVARIRRIASVNAEVLITGPTGVGKELYARAIHAASPRAERSFVPVNCGALPAELIENELFGHVAGAFTGARLRSDGLVAAAEGGTLFLDEIDGLGLHAQMKLLRFIQQKEYRRLGEPRVRKADVRIVAATNTDLEQAVEHGTFRSDLYFRLRVIPLEIPPLRERPEDIPVLLSMYTEHYAREYGLSPVKLSSEARQVLERYPWPGNVRELENCVRYLTCLQLARQIEMRDLPLLVSKTKVDECTRPLEGHITAGNTMQQAKREVVLRFEREYLERALAGSDGNISAAAKASGKARRAFFELMRKHGLSAGRSLTHGGPPGPPAKGASQ